MPILSRSPAFPIVGVRTWSIQRGAKFLGLWTALAAVPALVGYFSAALLGAWAVWASGLIRMPYQRIYANVLHDYLIWSGPAELAHDLPDAAALAAMAGGTLLAAALAHRRPVKSWITSAASFRWRPLVWGMVVFGIIFAAGLALQGTLSPDGYRPYLGWARQTPSSLALYLIGLPLVVLVRAASEELLFRGWILERLATLTGWLPIALVGSALGFTYVHGEFGAGRFVQLFVTGIAFAWAASRTGGLEWSIGLHTGWNLVVRLLHDNVSVPMPADPALREAALLSLPQKSALEWAILIALPLFAVLLTEVVLRTPRLRRLVGLNSSAGAAHPPSA
jgi:membrane protease YdiL (CAAX protease family)